MKRNRFLLLCAAIVLCIAVLPSVLLASSEESDNVGESYSTGCNKGSLSVTLPKYAFVGTNVNATVAHEGEFVDGATLTPDGVLQAREGNIASFFASAPGEGSVTYAGSIAGCRSSVGLIASARVTVLDVNMELQNPKTTMSVGESYLPVFSFFPAEDSADIENVDDLWASALGQLREATPTLSVKGNALSVSGDRLIAAEAGTAVVTASLPGTPVSFSFSVTVIAVSDVIPVTTLAVRSNAQMKTGETLTLVPTFSPANATNADGAWSLSKNGVVTVEGNVFTAVTPGKVTATYTLSDSTRSVSCVITVIDGGKIPVTGVTVANQKQIPVGDTVTIAPLFSPADASNQNGTWILSAQGIVSRYGNDFTGLKAGTVNAIFQSEDGNFVATCKIVVVGDATVTPAPSRISSVTVDTSTAGWIDNVLYLKPDDSVDVEYTVTPADADRSVLTWHSSNPEVLTCYNANLTAMGPGEATVSISVDGKQLASFKVVVE